MLLKEYERNNREIKGLRLQVALRHTGSFSFFPQRAQVSVSPLVHCQQSSESIILQTSEILIPRVLCCGIMLLYPVKICHLYWVNKMLIGQYPGRKYRGSAHTRRILGRGKAEMVVIQRKQNENAALRKGTKSSS